MATGKFNYVPETMNGTATKDVMVKYIGKKHFIYEGFYLLNGEWIATMWNANGKWCADRKNKGMYLNYDKKHDFLK